MDQHSDEIRDDNGHLGESAAPVGALDPVRFVRAQDERGAFDQALGELRAGRKRTHWVWFVFPQLAGLGTSSMSERYAIETLDAARSYLTHPVLGERLRLATEAAATAGAESVEELMGDVDARKLRSSMTLFAAAATDPQDAAGFTRVLDRWFGGRPDPVTLERLAGPV